jgi:hypothetical protein
MLRYRQIVLSRLARSSAELNVFGRSTPPPSRRATEMGGMKCPEWVNRVVSAMLAVTADVC